MKNNLSVFIAILALWPQLSVAQVADDDSSWKNIKRNTAVVIFSGVGGGVLGLSTLSFYGKPEEHTANITNGALIGILGGVAYVMTRTSKPAEPPPWGVEMGPSGTSLSWRWDY